MQDGSQSRLGPERRIDQAAIRLRWFATSVSDIERQRGEVSEIESESLSVIRGVKF